MLLLCLLCRVTWVSKLVINSLQLQQRNVPNGIIMSSGHREYTFKTVAMAIIDILIDIVTS